MSRIFTWTVLIIVAAIWGGAFAAIRYILEYCHLDAVGLLIYRFIPTAIISILAILIFYRRNAFKLFIRYWWLFLIISILWLFGYHYALNLGETVLPAGPAGLIIGTYPIFTIFLAAIFLNEKLTWGKVIGGLTGFAGVAFLVIFGGSHEGARLEIEPSQWIIYSLIILAAAFFAAIQTVISKPYLTGENPDGIRMDPILMTFLYMAPAAILLIPFMVVSPPPVPASFDAGFWITLGFLVIFCTLAAYIGWLWAIEKFGAGQVAISTYIIPIFSLVYARLWLNEPMGAPTIVGAVLIVIGVIVANISQNPNRIRAATVRERLGSGHKKIP